MRNSLTQGEHRNDKQPLSESTNDVLVPRSCTRDADTGLEPGGHMTLPIVIVELMTALVLAGAVALVLAAALDLAPVLMIATLLIKLCIAALILRYWPSPHRGLGPANRVTLLRAALVSVVAGASLLPQAMAAGATWFALLSLLALTLDGVDGWIARRSGSASAFGARFDMELDAFFILVLCLAVWQLDKAGIWVLCIGAMRYVFLLAMHRWSWLAGELPDSLRRKAVCVLQVGSLMICLLPAVSAMFASTLLLISLLSLSLSFAIDIAWLYRHAHATASTDVRQGVQP